MSLSRRSFLAAVGGSSVLSSLAPSALAAEAGGLRPLGVAQIDVTPDYPVRLNGFGNRREEFEGITQRIWAKAMAIGQGEQDTAVLLAVDNLGVTDRMVRELAAKLQKEAGVRPERLAVTSTHTHTAPMLTNMAPTLFGTPIPPAHQKHIDQYTVELAGKLHKVALAALADRKPARLAWAQGKVTFAHNRRVMRGGKSTGLGVNQVGPVDHDLPMLVAQDPAGKLRAVLVSYACHCVNLSDNKISGDWAGFAQQQIQDEHPGAIAMVAIGCGGDQNPKFRVTGGRADLAAKNGDEIAREVRRLLAGKLTPLVGKLTTAYNRIDLPFDTPPDRAEWEKRAKRDDPTGHHARVQLARLDRGEALQTKLDYPIQTWKFGKQLAMVFLPGEVVVDFSLRLKREFDARRLWVNAYSNDVPCYIPSERVLKEGGYEGIGAMIPYDRPTRLKPGVEKLIVDTVSRQLAGEF